MFFKMNILQKEYEIGKFIVHDKCGGKAKLGRLWQHEFQARKHIVHDKCGGKAKLGRLWQHEFQARKHIENFFTRVLDVFSVYKEHPEELVVWESENINCKRVTNLILDFEIGCEYFRFEIGKLLKRYMPNKYQVYGNVLQIYLYFHEGENLDYNVIYKYSRSFHKAGGSEGKVVLGEYVTTLQHKIVDPFFNKQQKVLTLYKIVQTVPLPNQYAFYLMFLTLLIILFISEALELCLHLLLLVFKI